MIDFSFVLTSFPLCLVAFGYLEMDKLIIFNFIKNLPVIDEATDDLKVDNFSLFR